MIPVIRVSEYNLTMLNEVISSNSRFKSYCKVTIIDNDSSGFIVPKFNPDLRIIDFVVGESYSSTYVTETDINIFISCTLAKWAKSLKDKNGRAKTQYTWMPYYLGVNSRDLLKVVKEIKRRLIMNEISDHFILGKIDREEEFLSKGHRPGNSNCLVIDDVGIFWELCSYGTVGINSSVRYKITDRNLFIDLVMKIFSYYLDGEDKDLYKTSATLSVRSPFGFQLSLGDVIIFNTLSGENYGIVQKICKDQIIIQSNISSLGLLSFQELDLMVSEYIEVRSFPVDYRDLKSGKLMWKKS